MRSEGWLSLYTPECIDPQGGEEGRRGEVRAERAKRATRRARPQAERSPSSGAAPRKCSGPSSEGWLSVCTPEAIREPRRKDTTVLEVDNRTGLRHDCPHSSTYDHPAPDRARQGQHDLHSKVKARKPTR